MAQVTTLPLASSYPDRLPAELLIDIFEIACLSDFNPFEDENCLSGLRSTRGAIAATSQRWRTIIQAVSSVWRVVSFTDLSPPNTQVKPIAPIHTHLPHGGSFVSNFSVFVNSQSDAYRNRAFNAMGSSLPRADSLVIQNRHTAGMYNAFLEDGKFPLLRNLVIDLEADPTLKTSIFGDLDLTKGPVIENLWLKLDGRHDLSLPSTELQTMKRISVRVNPRLVTDVAQLIRNSPNLETLEWVMPNPTSFFHLPSTLPTQSFPNLRAVSITGIDALSVLKTMDAPNVERLSITIEKLQSAPMWDDGILYGCPTFPKLKHISIDDPSISAQELALYLAQHPLLEEIVLHRDLEGAVLDLLVNSHITHPHLKRVWAAYHPMEEGCYDPRPAAFEEMRNRRTSSSSSSSRYLRDVEHLTLHLLDSDRCSNWMWGPKYDSLWKSTELFSLTRRSALPSSMTEYWDWRLKIAF